MSVSVLYYHVIWRTKRSERTIVEDDERELYGYIYGYCKNKKCTLIRIGGMPDHIHMLVSIRPDMSVSSFVQVLKGETSKWLKTKSSKFPNFDGWADGYAVFSYSERDKEMIRNYIMGQKKHHQSKTLAVEYMEIQKAFDIDPEKDTFLKDR